MDSVAGQAIAGTITAMLVALFSLLVRAMLKVGDRDVNRYEGEVKRLQGEVAEQKRDAAMWRQMYLAVAAKTGVTVELPTPLPEEEAPPPGRRGTP